MTWRAAIADAGALAGGSHADGVIEHDVEWLLARCDQPDKAVLVLSDGHGRTVPVFSHDGEIGYNLGEIELGSKAVRRYVLIGHYPDLSVDDWEAIFRVLERHLGRNAAVYLLGVVWDEGLHLATRSAAVRKMFWVSQHGKTYSRRFCDIRGGHEAYLQRLTARHRKVLRRSLRRFQHHFQRSASFHVYSELGAVKEFIERVEPVSARTYQARLLGLHINRSGHIGAQMIEGARRGLVRCYLLAIDDRPIAWRVGFVYEGTFFSHYVGYDPDFAKWHPGAVTHLYSLRDLANASNGVRTVDLLYGDNEFKRKVATTSRREANFYLIPKTASGNTTHAILVSCNKVSAMIGKVLEFSGLKHKVKRSIRRRSPQDGD